MWDKSALPHADMRISDQEIREQLFLARPVVGEFTDREPYTDAKVVRHVLEWVLGNRSTPPHKQPWVQK